MLAYTFRAHPEQVCQAFLSPKRGMLGWYLKWALDATLNLFCTTNAVAGDRHLPEIPESTEN